MHPADIKASLAKAGYRQFELARELKVTQAAVHLVIRGATKSKRIASAISRVTKQPVRLLWPGKYPDLEKLQAIQASKPSAGSARDTAAHIRATTPTKQAA